MTDGSAQLCVESDVSICAIEIRWHDRRGQHGDMLDQMCQYTPMRKYKLLRNRLAICELLSYEMILELCYEQCRNCEYLLRLYYEL